MTLNTTYNMTLSQCIDLHQSDSTDSVYVTSFSYDDTDNSCISLWPVFLPPSDNCTNTSDVTLYTNLDRQDTVANRSWAIILPGTVHRWHLDITIFIIEFPHFDFHFLSHKYAKQNEKSWRRTDDLLHSLTIQSIHLSLNSIVWRQSCLPFYQWQTTNTDSDL